MLKFYKEELDISKVSGIITKDKELPPETIRDIISIIKDIEEDCKR